MSDAASTHLRALPQVLNPYTDDAPLRVRDHPLSENRPVLLIAALVGIAPLVWLIVRVVGGFEPALTGELILALSIGLPLGTVIAAFPMLLGSGARLTLGATTLHRQLRAPRGRSRTITLTDIRAGIYASKVRHRRELSKELILLLGDGEILWIADGIAPADVEKVAHALATYGVREYAEGITNDQLATLIRKARRLDGR